MKIVITENISKRAEEILRAADPSWQIVNLVGTKTPVTEAIADADAMLIRTATRVTPELLDGARQLRVIGRAGVGVDNVDIDAATRRGVVVMNTPGGNSISVAEHTFSFLTALARHVVVANASMKQGLWEKKKFTGVELRGKTLGIVGLGRVGSAVARLGQAYEMTMLAYDPYVSPRVAAERGVKLVGFEELLQSCDFLTLHCSLTPETRGMIDARALSLTRPGVRVVNCARGEVLVAEALLAALESGHVAGAALDGEAARLAAMIDPSFLAGAGWDPAGRAFCFPAGHPMLGRGTCRAEGCGSASHRKCSGVCWRCFTRLTGLGMTAEQIASAPWLPPRRPYCRLSSHGAPESASMLGSISFLNSSTCPASTNSSCTFSKGMPPSTSAS